MRREILCAFLCLTAACSKLLIGDGHSKDKAPPQQETTAVVNQPQDVSPRPIIQIYPPEAPAKTPAPRIQPGWTWYNIKAFEKEYEELLGEAMLIAGDNAVRKKMPVVFARARTMARCQRNGLSLLRAAGWEEGHDMRRGYRRTLALPYLHLEKPQGQIQTEYDFHIAQHRRSARILVQQHECGMD